MKWRCDRCKTVHDSNPTECKNCDYTVFTQFRVEPPDDFEPDDLGPFYGDEGEGEKPAPSLVDSSV